jgi:hypothetical protein
MPAIVVFTEKQRSKIRHACFIDRSRIAIDLFSLVCGRAVSSPAQVSENCPGTIVSRQID